MNALQVHGNWNLVKGKLKQQFASLTDNDLLHIEGREEELVGRLQRALGKTREEIVNFINSAAKTNDQADAQWDDFEDEEDDVADSERAA